MRPPIGETEPILERLCDELEAKTKVKANSDRNCHLRTLLIHALDEAWNKGFNFKSDKKINLYKISVNKPSSMYNAIDVNVLASDEKSAKKKIIKRFPKVFINNIKLDCNIHIR